MGMAFVRGVSSGYVRSRGREGKTQTACGGVVKVQLNGEIV